MGKRRHQMAYLLVDRKKQAGGKSYYWQKNAAKTAAEKSGGTMLQLSGYWKPMNEEPDLVYTLYCAGSLLGIYTDKARLMEAYQAVVGDTPLTYEELAVGADSYYVQEMVLNVTNS